MVHVRLNNIYHGYSGKLATERRNRYVHYITLAIMIAMLLPIIDNLIDGSYSIAYFLIAGEIVLFTLFMLNKNSKLKNSLSVLVFVVLCIATFLMFLKNGARNHSVLIYPSLLFVSSLTYNRKVVYSTLCCALIAIWTSGLLQLYGVLNLAMSEYMSISYLLELTAI